MRTGGSRRHQVRFGGGRILADITRSLRLRGSSPVKHRDAQRVDRSDFDSGLRLALAIGSASSAHHLLATFAGALSFPERWVDPS